MTFEGTSHGFNHVRKEMLGDDSLHLSLRRELLHPPAYRLSLKKEG
jgi:hypothetical protein